MQYIQYVVRRFKAMIYAWLAIILCCNIHGVEAVFDFIPSVTVTSNNGELQIYLNEKILVYTLYLAVLEAIDNYLTISIKRKII